MMIAPLPSNLRMADERNRRGTIGCDVGCTASRERWEGVLKSNADSWDARVQNRGMKSLGYWVRQRETARGWQ